MRLLFSAIQRAKRTDMGHDKLKTGAQTPESGFQYSAVNAWYG